LPQSASAGKNCTGTSTQHRPDYRYVISPESILAAVCEKKKQCLASYAITHILKIPYSSDFDFKPSSKSRLCIYILVNFLLKSVRGGRRGTVMKEDERSMIFSHLMYINSTKDTNARYFKIMKIISLK
jgi:hypothetical protein